MKERLVLCSAVIATGLLIYEHSVTTTHAYDFNEWVIQSEGDSTRDPPSFIQGDQDEKKEDRKEIEIGMTSTGIAVSDLNVSERKKDEISPDNIKVVDIVEISDSYIENRVPQQLIIPSLNVEAPISPVGLTGNGEMAVKNSAIEVGWYQYGPAPGHGGNAILRGHKDWNGQSGSLSRLHKLKTDDVVEVIFDDDERMKFKLVSTTEFAIKNVPSDVMSIKNGDNRLTIITCSGPFGFDGYENRIVTVFEAVND